MVILGYVFTVINYVCYCISRFAKEKKTILLLDVVAKIFTIMGLYCLGSLTGSYNMILMLILLLVANYKERNTEKFGIIATVTGYIVFQVIYLVICYYTFCGLSSLLVTISSSVTLLCIWWLSPQKMRVVGGFNSFVYLSYQISIRNWAGLIEIFVIISNFVAFWKYKHK